MSSSCGNMSPLTGASSEKYLRRLIGRTDIEDGLKRLDKLTQEEARMATAQVLKVMHTVDDRIGVVDDRVARVNDTMAGVDVRVRAVDSTVTQVIQGSQSIFSQLKKMFNLDQHRG